MSRKRKAQRKAKSAKATRERKPTKKRKIRIVDSSQLKLSDYMGFSKPPPIRPRYDEGGNLNPFVRSAFLPMVPKEPLVPGISARLSIKTCFRVGEALKVGRMIANGNFTGDVLVGLYGIPALILMIIYVWRRHLCLRETIYNS